MRGYVAVIIVTYNSEKFLTKCLDALSGQLNAGDQLIIVDSASQDTDYLKKAEKAAQSYSLELILCKDNVGFCKGNNIGYAHVRPDVDFVLFLNPDLFLTPLQYTFIDRATELMAQPQHRQVGAMTGLLLGYDINKDQPTGLVDSAAIFSSWYGRWYDRDQGTAFATVHYDEWEHVPALCGALMFCRKEALDQVLLSPNEVMDNTFYMYKEDIDLSLRLHAKRWKLLFCSTLLAYHCRGWSTDRTKVDRRWRLLSAKNEMALYRRLKSPCYFYSTLKFLAVKYFNI